MTRILTIVQKQRIQILWNEGHSVGNIAARLNLPMKKVRLIIWPLA
ncbi:MAG: helix-turn-helix domain-containing protein [Aphanothece sp. CMT-3BRIN-NPC111]|jgi:hypothetical protein|nr:helix-turn-helix domain-containing protein [Aphanothece sp. CMT-3BRIN-NPC111]